LKSTPVSLKWENLFECHIEQSLHLRFLLGRGSAVDVNNRDQSYVVDLTQTIDLGSLKLIIKFKSIKWGSHSIWEKCYAIFV
jgi:hypothetical protein